jgi:hypothetical protein
MRTKLIALLVLSLVTPNATFAQAEDERLAIQCIYFREASRFIDIEGDFEILNEIESFFLISFDKDPSPNRLPLRFGKPLVVFDAATPESREYNVELTARKVKGGLSLTVAPIAKSRFQWKGAKDLPLKDGDSIFLKSKDDYLWILFRQASKQSIP